MPIAAHRSRPWKIGVGCPCILAVRCRSWTRVPERLANSCKQFGRTPELQPFASGEAWIRQAECVQFDGSLIIPAAVTGRTISHYRLLEILGRGEWASFTRLRIAGSTGSLQSSSYPTRFPTILSP